MTVSFRGLSTANCTRVVTGRDERGLGWVRAYDADGVEALALFGMTNAMMNEVAVSGGSAEPAADMVADLAATAVDHEYRLCLMEVGI